MPPKAIPTLFISEDLKPYRTAAAAYLEYLLERTAWMDIPGPQGKLPIEKVYIPLTIQSEEARKAVALEDALTHPRLVIVGEPGAGKTTFLRHLAYLWTRALQDANTNTLLFPILIRISELVEHFLHCQEKADRPPDSPDWLIDFLNSQNHEWNWGLPADLFREKLTSGSCLILLDGLDEAPDSSVGRLLEKATQDWPHCRFVVTTRPLSFNSLAGFETVRIASPATSPPDPLLH